MALLCLPLPRRPKEELAGLLRMKGGFQGLAWAGSGQLILTLTLVEQVASLRGPTAIWRRLLTNSQLPTRDSAGSPPGL